ncbi:LCP family protein [Candidatus Saccharibacteria bacterium]|nr:LCP family protein [Candidatus Saccharibacteria bacterium]
MDKNKSIDGLTTRRSKKATTSPTKKTSTSAKTTKKPKVVKSKTTTKPKTKSTSKTIPITNGSQETSPIIPAPAETLTPIPETIPADNSATDFLSPVQAFDFDEQSGKLTASKTPTKKATKKMKKEEKPKSKKRKIITRILICFLILIIGLAVVFVLWGNDIIAKITGGQGNVFDLLTFVEETYEPLKTDENNRTNILAIGTSGYNMEGDEGNGKHDGAQLTDSIMIISLNQETGDVAMLSLPRDLKASPTCTATGKINEVYWCNNLDGDNEQAGAEALMTEVGSILGIDFQYYAHLNWGSLVQIVNILDGITVTLDEDISDYNYTKAVFKAGEEYTIDGEQALGLARARHGTTNGDFTRGASQQKILIGIKNKILEKQLSLTDIIDLASTLGDNLRTNFTISEMKTLAHLTTDFDFENMRQLSLIEPNRLMTTANINEISYVVPVGGVGNYSTIRNYIAKMLDNDPRVYEDSSILVLNGTEEVGIASAEVNQLEKDGYKNVSAGDAPTSDYTEPYTLYVLTEEAPNTKKLLEKKYNLTTKPAEELPEGISQDYDFVLILGTTDTNTQE